MAQGGINTMSIEDRTCARTAALSPEDQDRVFRMTSIYLSAAGDLVGLVGVESMPRLEAAERVRKGAEQAAAAADLIDGTLSGSIAVTERVATFLCRALAEARDCLAMSTGYLAQVESGVDPFGPPPSRCSREVPLSTVQAELEAQVADEQADVELLLRLLS